VKVVVVTLRTEVPVPPEARVTVGGFREVVTVGLLGLTVDDKEIVPEKPWLVRVIWEVLKLPAGIIRLEGEAVIEKSGANTTKFPRMLVGWMVQ
jgi:hypothetical protein